MPCIGHSTFCAWRILNFQKLESPRGCYSGKRTSRNKRAARAHNLGYLASGDCFWLVPWCANDKDCPRSADHEPTIRRLSHSADGLHHVLRFSIGASRNQRKASWLGSASDNWLIINQRPLKEKQNYT